MSADGGGAPLTDYARLAAVPAQYAQPHPDTLATLPKPYKKDSPKGSCAECGGFHGLPALHLAYMGHAEVTLALLDVDPCWTWEPLAFAADGLPLIRHEGYRYVLWARLTVRGRTVIGVGTCESSKGDPEKELIGDFLRNAAMRFGVGTKLWSKATAADPAGRDDVTTTARRQPAQRAARQDAPAADIVPGGITPAQIRKMQAMFTERGIRDRPAKLAFIASVLSRDVASSNELTPAEGGQVIDELDKVPVPAAEPGVLL